MVTNTGKGGRGEREGGGSMVMEGDLAWDSEHTIKCTDDVL